MPAERKEAPKPPPAPVKPALKKLPNHMSGPSIKSVLNGGPMGDEKLSTIEQHQLYTKQDLFEEFTLEQLNDRWKEYLTTLDDRPNMKSTLSRTPILKDDGTLLLMIDNHVQEELIRSIKPQLVSWLRRELKNSSIDLFIEINDTGTQKFAYTDGEKLEEMLKKNPDLAILKQRFNLDFEG